jgi:hypothetical protein
MKRIKVGTVPAKADTEGQENFKKKLLALNFQTFKKAA